MAASLRLSPDAGHLYTARNGLLGFDCSEKLTPRLAEAFFADGYDFAVRYVGRVVMGLADLTADEAQAILAAGLGLMIVQHVALPGWVATRELGATYGAAAARFVADMGFPPGMMIWLDQEGIAPITPASQCEDYANTWHAAVALGGFLPGIYLGWHSGLTGAQAYRGLRFTHYWGAYNADGDQTPAVRGWQMKQHAPQMPYKTPLAATQAGLAFDVNVVTVDALGGSPVILAPAGWRGASIGASA